VTRRLPLLLLLLAAAAPPGVPADAPRSGYDDASPAVQAMQDDDGANPAMLWVAAGRALWDQPAGPRGQGCASCHGPPEAMRGVAARYPAWDAALSRPVTLEARINQSRVGHQGAPALPEDGADMLALAALVGLQSRGLPTQVDGDGPAAPALAQGRALFNTRMGQLDLSCADCHESRAKGGLAGNRLGGARIPEGRANAYPIYRLEWQGMGGVLRRIRNCMTGVRAEPFLAGSEEMAALRLYLGWRSNGLPVETPGVRP
jgi:sulfur-oxidizing protein SoxA